MTKIVNSQIEGESFLFNDWIICPKCEKEGRGCGLKITKRGNTVQCEMRVQE